MRLIDLSGSREFQRACRQLWEQVDTSHDLVIGIATGGSRVVDGMGLPKDIAIETVKCQREGTSLKHKMEWLFRLIPNVVSNKLRRIEASLRAWLFHRSIRKGGAPKRCVLYGDGFSDAVNRSRSLLIVDDAIDTGATTKAVVECVREINPSVRIRIAVLTLTMDTPLVTPDYTLYRHALIRFPWSSDA